MAAVIRAALRSRDAVRASRPSFSLGSGTFPFTPVPLPGYGGLPSRGSGHGRGIAQGYGGLLSRGSGHGRAYPPQVSSMLKSKSGPGTTLPQVDKYFILKRGMSSKEPVQPPRKEMGREELDMFFEKSWLGRTLMFILTPTFKYQRLLAACSKDEKYREAGEGMKVLSGAIMAICSFAFVILGAILEGRLKKVETELVAEKVAQDAAGKEAKTLKEEFDKLREFVRRHLQAQDDRTASIFAILQGLRDAFMLDSEVGKLSEIVDAKTTKDEVQQSNEAEKSSETRDGKAAKEPLRERRPPGPI